MSARKAPDKRIQRYLEWYSKRLNGQSEDLIRRGFEERGLGEFGSSMALYLQLANDGFPVCKECGETPVQPGHCKKPADRRKRQPTTGKGAMTIELPPASAAKDLFRNALKDLDRYIGFVEFEEGWLRGGNVS